ncbi:putative nuclease HARBI1 [Cataglyphis hispanica]|uniref:putative nuclease HARBI1 n=1 Tax=Cataglyphis hispanica TaxID=1086592 RepID=UPI00217F6572|nr:putative nuclease HARBI1 [Cataglyphis hispanica]
MTILQFERLLELVQEPLTKKIHGCNMQTIAWNFYVLKSIVSKVIRDICKIIWDYKLSPMYLPRPTMNDFKRYSRDFQKLWNMPNCFGAIDGKHIVIQAPYNTGTSFFNYKKTFSIVLMAVCDAKYIFTLVDVGAFGSQNDGGVFKETAFGIAYNNEVEIPDNSCLPRIDIKFPYYIVADEAFPLKSYIIATIS